VNDQETEKSALCSESGSKLPNGSKEEENNLRLARYRCRFIIPEVTDARNSHFIEKYLFIS
jgi:hypothetical protein